MQYGITIPTLPARWPRDRRRRAGVSLGGHLALVLAGCLVTLEMSA